ncbi:hypothetical protein NE237_023549 [Protea cynaroides]|uniref:Beta-fructofuranosidase n=1 Tax=Protea cynaroides TaxID=273540 RepID=A0A9Q0HF97_9MAGN|nr:hypothetical protein NE237_023549 [Protea cynaroides]
MGLKQILNLCLTDGLFPSLLVNDGSCMIDQQMGIHDHPLEIDALFYSALRYFCEMLALNDGSKNLVTAINNELSATLFHDPVSELIMLAEILDPPPISVSELLFHVLQLKRYLG